MRWELFVRQKCSPHYMYVRFNQAYYSGVLYDFNSLRRFFMVYKLRNHKNYESWRTTKIENDVTTQSRRIASCISLVRDPKNIESWPHVYTIKEYSGVWGREVLQIRSIIREKIAKITISDFRQMKRSRRKSRVLGNRFSFHVVVGNDYRYHYF